MKITIDTKEDKHELNHLISLLRALLENRSTNSNIFDSGSPGLDSSTPQDSTGLFNLFDQPATEEKKEDKSFEDHLQLY